MPDYIGGDQMDRVQVPGQVVDNHRRNGEAARHVDGRPTLRGRRRLGTYALLQPGGFRFAHSAPRVSTLASGRTTPICNGMTIPDPADDPATLVKDLQALVADAACVAGFTGAGISTESGVPDFRSPNSPWMRNKPIPFEAFLRSPEARAEAWRRKF